jgi:GntR family transcriptional regulator
LYSGSRGRGTFINPASASIKINLVPGEEFTKLIAGNGHQATTAVMDISTRPATQDEVKRLGIAPGTELCSVEKLYCADGTPAIISVDRFPTTLVENLPTAEYLSGHPIFDYLRDEAGIAIVRDKIEIESITHLRACQLAKAGAQLCCETALAFNGINYNRDNVPVMVDTEIYDTSIVKFELLRVKDVC